ncbi:MAG: MATE family efflux transporter [Candidatus Methylomirabilis oxyfera]|nr:MATE family efflux transporter [Candidatus Methylomirabilis oxyfera]
MRPAPASSDGPLLPPLVRLALPIAGSNLLQRGVGIVDTLMVGRLGAAELAAVGLSQLLIFFLMALVYGLGIGCTVAVAYHTGAGDHDERARAIRASLLLGLWASVGLTVLGLWVSEPTARFLGALGSVLSLTVDYLVIIWTFFVFKVMLHMAACVFYGVGDSRTPLAVIIFVNIIHVGVAFPLIFGWAGAPRMGVPGAAIAAVASEAFGAVLLVVMAFRRGWLSWRGRWGDPTEVRRIIAIGSPAMGERLITHGMQLIYAKLVIGFGVAAYAAHQVGLNIEALSFLPALGFAQAATTLVGQRLGAGQGLAARRSGIHAAWLAVAVMAAFGVSYLLFPSQWVALFTSDQEVAGYGRTLMWIMALLQPPLALALALKGALRGAGETRVVLYAAILGGWVVRIPLAYLFGVQLGLGLVAVWLTMWLDWWVRAAVVLLRYRHLPWREIRL